MGHSKDEERKSVTNSDFTRQSDWSEGDDFDLAQPVGMEELRGSLSGNLRVRIVRPKNPEFKRVAAGELEATEAVERPHNGMGRVLYHAKRFFVGVPIPTTMAESEYIS